MAYLKPQAFTRHVVNPLASMLQTGGVATLTVPGRRTGRARTVPVIPVEVEVIRYLVSPYGESDWVRNLRAAGKATLARKGKAETFQASEIAVPGRAAIIGGLPEGLRTHRGPVFHQTARSQRPSGVSPR